MATKEEKTFFQPPWFKDYCIKGFDLNADYLDTGEFMDRCLVVSKLEEDQNTVEIVGTRVVPEFGSLALVIMAVIVAGVIFS